MTAAKKMPLRERLRRAFDAATSDLKPRGRLPQGMTTEQAARAVAAYAAVNLERFAAAGEAMQKILAEDWGDDDDDERGDVWDDPELRPQETAPGQPPAPGSIPQGAATPEQIKALLAEQDRETCRRFAIELLRWIVDDGAERGELTRAGTVELRRDLEMREEGALMLVAKLYDRATAPTLIKADPEPDQGDDDEREGDDD